MLEKKKEKKGEIVISAILLRFIYFITSSKIFLPAALLAVLDISTHN
jgi:hypothetical protein